MPIYMAFLKIDGIEGEVAEQDHKGSIELLSFQWGVGRGAASGTQSSGSGGGAGKVNFQDFHFTKKPDRASSQIFLKLDDTERKAGGYVLIEHGGLDQAGGASESPFYKVMFEGIMFTQFMQGGHPLTPNEEFPTEQVSFNFHKAQIMFPSSQPSTGVS